MIVLNDEEIVRLYYERSEDGIAQSEQKYGRLCRSVIRRILPDERDAEECLSDVWIRTWNSIPPEKPRVLGAFLARIARNLALDKLSYNGAGKRASALTEAFEELEPCLVGADDTQKSVEASEFSIWLQAFLRAQTRENRVFFVRRYWYGGKRQRDRSGMRVQRGKSKILALPHAKPSARSDAQGGYCHMNDRKFDVFQHAADQTMLEEAQRPMKKNHIRARAATAAACVCVVAAAVILQPWNNSKSDDPPGNGGNVQIANPWSDTTLAQIRAMGYALTLPDGAENAAFTALNVDETGAEMVQASYTLDGTAYTCRAAKASDPEDISGLYESWDQDLSWTVGEAQLQLCTNHLTGYVSWFLPDEGQQWCVSSSGSDAELLENARILAAGLGQELATAPEGAEDVVISVFSQDGRTVAETAFTLSGARWVYRTAPGELELVDISGLGSFSLSAAGKVSYCDAQLSYDEGGAGKIIWFDIVPGIEYSLSVDTGASAEALTNMADTLFIPMQGDA